MRSGKVVRLPALLLALLLLLCSCTGGGGPEGTGTEQPTETEPPEIVLTLAEGGKSRYKIIFPENGGTEYVRTAERISDAVKSAAGVRPDSGSDFLLPGREPGEYEILLGPTNRPESAQAAAQLRQGEYVIRTVGNKLVICGSSAASTEAAAARFLSGLPKDAAGILTYSSASDYAKINTYRIKDCVVGGQPLSAFGVTYDPSSGCAEYAARAFADHIARYSGYQPPIRADAAEAGPAFRFLPGGNAGTYAITVRTGEVTVTAGSYPDFFDALYAMTDLFAASDFLELKAGETFTGQTENKLPAQTEKAAGSVRVMFHNVWGYQSEYPVLCRASLALDVYCAYAPDVLCFEEAGNLYRGSAKNVYAWFSQNGYREICFSAEGGIGNPIYFNTAVLKLLDSGYGHDRAGDKGTTWAVFERIADGMRFAVTNSHFAANSNAGGDAALGDQYRTQDAKCAAGQVEKIRQTYPGIPVILGGDCNSVKSSEAYRVLTGIGAVNVRDSAAGSWSVPSAFHGSFQYDTETGLYDLVTQLGIPGSSAIDHILTLGGITPLRWRIVDDSAALTCSDHAPHFADFSLSAG